MEFLLDTANIEEIKHLNDCLPLSGVTTNPSIIKKEGKIDFFHHMKEIRKIIGFNKTLHVQVVATDYEGMVKDAEAILENIDEEIYIKIPVTKEGLKAIRELKSRNVNVTATAIYTKAQAYLAIASGADYIAPYYNRMEKLDIDPKDNIRSMANLIKQYDSQTRILAASFKNIGQVNTAFEIGAQAATISADILEESLSIPSVIKAVNDFKADWENIYGEHSTIIDY